MKALFDAEKVFLCLILICNYTKTLQLNFDSVLVLYTQIIKCNRILENQPSTHKN